MVEIVDIEDLTPEMRLMWLVLYTYFEDIDTIHRRDKSPLKSSNQMYRDDRPDCDPYRLWDMICDPHTRIICDLAGVEYSHFKRQWKQYVWDVLNLRI